MKNIIPSQSRNLMTFVMTVRDDFQAIANISNLFELSKHTGMLLLIGYGGENPFYFEQLELKTKLYNSQGANVKLYANESLLKRFNWAFEHDCEWVLFVSDDDPITTNHAMNYYNYINDSKNDISGISAIVPDLYFVVNDKKLESFQPINIVNDNLFERMKCLLLSQYVGIRFWSAYRCASIRSAVLEATANSFMPSYFDQLLVFSACLKGNSVKYNAIGGVFYDINNWSTPQKSIESDLRFYINSLSVFFHELYWVRDYARILSESAPPADFIVFFKNYAIAKLEQARLVLPLRISVIDNGGKIDELEIRQIFELIQSVKEELELSRSWDDIRSAFEFKDKTNLHIDQYIV